MDTALVLIGIYYLGMVLCKIGRVLDLVLEMRKKGQEFSFKSVIYTMLKFNVTVITLDSDWMIENWLKTES